jgi:hypothetical protein
VFETELARHVRGLGSLPEDPPALLVEQLDALLDRDVDGAVEPGEAAAGLDANGSMSPISAIPDSTALR